MFDGFTEYVHFLSYVIDKLFLKGREQFAVAPQIAGKAGPCGPRLLRLDKANFQLAMGILEGTGTLFCQAHSISQFLE